MREAFAARGGLEGSPGNGGGKFRVFIAGRFTLT
jgi:hypothetical protein